MLSGFIRVGEMSVKLKFFQGQGILGSVGGKMKFCQNVREFYISVM